MTGFGKRLDGRALVDHPRIVEQQHRPRLDQGEALARRAVGLEHTGLAALDALARDEEHRHQIHPVAVRGMTLLEVMVALAVFAIAGLAVMKTASEHLSALNYLEQKTLATWVVENQLVQQKLENKWPGDSWAEGDEQMAGSTWYWRYRGVATADNNFRALDMEVRTEAKAENPVTMMRTYISR